MVLLVPFDGSALSERALERAIEFSEHVGEEVLVLTVLPDDGEFARERGWVDEGERYDTDRTAREFESRVREVAPEATFRVDHPSEESMRTDSTTDVARTVRQVAHEVDASIVFVGSENAGRVTTPVSSVGDPVSEDPDYDVHIVRHAN
jgi:nucleotide-binding universal stress UspA family protein